MHDVEREGGREKKKGAPKSWRGLGLVPEVLAIVPRANKSFHNARHKIGRHTVTQCW